MRLNRLKPGPNCAPKKLVLAVAIAALSPTPALSDGLYLDEIVVTATKKDEMVQDVPSTVNVFTTDTLQELNVFDFKDIETLTPGLSLTNIDARNSAISLRGITYNPDARANEGVTTYLNSVPIRPDIAFQQMYDLSRVEILRGPQGTLQGETSPAGSIQLYTKKANLEAFEGDIIQTFSDNSGSNTQLAVSTPIIEGVLGVRVAGLYDAADTDTKTHSSVGGREGTRDTRSGRLGVYWLPTDELSLDFTFQHLEQHFDGFQIVEGNNAYNPELSFKDRTSLSQGPSDIMVRANLASLELNYEFAGHLLTSLSGYQETINRADEDRDSGNLGPASLNPLTGQLSPSWEDTRFVNSDYLRFTQEIRLTNTDSDFWEYTAGLFYQKTRIDTFNSFRGDLLSETFSPIPGVPLAMVLGQVDLDIPITEEKLGAFWDSKWYVTDATTVGMGMRWQKTRSGNKATLDQTNIDPRIPNQELIADNEQDQKGIAWTGGLKITHDLNETVMLYGAYDNSYRPPAYSITPSAGQGIGASQLQFDEETSDSLELGFKSNIAHGRYQLNGSVFYQSFKDYISFANTVAFDSSAARDGITESIVQGGITFNGDAIIRGAELEFNGVLSKNWTTYWAMSYIDSKFDGAMRPLATLGAPVTDGVFVTETTDGRVGPEPNWSISTSSEYIIPMGDIDGFIRGLYKFNDNRADDGSGTNIGGYGIFDLFLGVKDSNERWEASLWSKNLFDKEARSAYGEIRANQLWDFSGAEPAPIPGALAGGYQEVSVIPGRIIGITVQYKLGVY